MGGETMRNGVGRVIGGGISGVQGGFSPTAKPEVEEREREYSKEEISSGFNEKFVLGPVPSKSEVEDAVSSLQRFFSTALYSQIVERSRPYTSKNYVADKVASPIDLVHRISSSEPEMDWNVPKLHLLNPKEMHSNEHKRIYDAFRSLQTEPSIQRMVISLSSDRALWEAVNNNEAVRELRESLYTVENDRSRNLNESPDLVACVLRWILDITKMKVMELLEKITKMLNEVLLPLDKQKITTADADLLDESLRSSVLLSIIVLLIVVVARARGI